MDCICQLVKVYACTLFYCCHSHQNFLKWNEPRLQQLPCHIYDPIPLGEGAGVGWRKDADSIAMPEGSTLYDLVQRGLSCTHAGVGAVVRLRKELSLVKDVPVLIAIDEVNFSVFVMFMFIDFKEISCTPL